MPGDPDPLCRRQRALRLIRARVERARGSMLFVRKFRRPGAGQTGAEGPRFDPAETDWTGVTASFYFFEPWCSEFVPPGPGEVVIAFGDGRDRHRGLQVDVWEDGKGVSLWLPDAARVFWSPEAQPDQRDLPWETRLRELNAVTGTFLDES